MFSTSEGVFHPAVARSTPFRTKSVFASFISPKCVFSVQKAPFHQIQPLRHHFVDISATVSPNEAILFALVSYRAPLHVGIGFMPWFCVCFCWLGQIDLTPLLAVPF